MTVTHVRRWHLNGKSVGCGHLYQGTYKSFPVESDGHLLTLLCYVERQRAARGSGGVGRGPAMVESVALAAPRSNGRRAVYGLARGAAAAVDDASKPSTSDRGVRRDTNLGATGTALRQRGLAGSNRRGDRPRIRVSPPRKAKERHLIGLIPFFVSGSSKSAARPSWRPTAAVTDD
jgi:hypothetical protein